MKTKLKKILTCIPFCIPFAYALLHLDYFGNYGWLHWFVYPLMLILPILGGISGRILPVAIGNAVGGTASVIITALTNDGFDEGWFKPFNSVSYAIMLAVLVICGQIILAAITRKIMYLIKNKCAHANTVKKILAAIAIIVITVCFTTGGILGVIYTDFDKAGIESAEYEYTVNHDEFVSIEIPSINVHIENDEVISTSEFVNKGISYYASVGETPLREALVLKVNQRLAYYEPFDIRYTCFTQNLIEDASGNQYGNFNAYQKGTDRLGRELLLTCIKSEKIDTIGVCTTQYTISYADSKYKPLTAEDIDDVFPISVTLEGYETVCERTSLF